MTINEILGKVAHDEWIKSMYPQIISATWESLGADKIHWIRVGEAVVDMYDSWLKRGETMELANVYEAVYQHHKFPDAIVMNPKWKVKFWELWEHTPPEGRFVAEGESVIPNRFLGIPLSFDDKEPNFSIRFNY